MKFYLLLTCFLFSFNALSKSRGYDAALVVSGGVSLGAYQGGFLSYITELQNQYPKESRNPQVFAGASAGSMNSLITLAELGRVNPNRSVKKSIYWNLWVPLGIDRLADKESMSPVNFLSKKPIQDRYDDLRRIWKEGLRKNYDVIFGVSLTQKEPELIEVYKGGRKYLQMLNEAIFRIRGRGPGIPPVIENYIVKENANKQIYIPFTKDQNKNLDLLFNVIEGSSAFPMAFGPAEIEYCKYDDYYRNKQCSKDKIRKHKFIDGGLFNNVPLSIVNVVTEDHVKKDNILLIIDPSDKHLTYRPPMAKAKGKSVADYTLSIFDSFIGTARSREMISFYEAPSFTNSMSSTVSLPLASEPLYAFFGFFEIDFRRFDFLVGYADAINFAGGYVQDTKGKKLDYKQGHYYGFNHDERCIIDSVVEKNFNLQCLNNVDTNLKTLLRISVGKLLETCSFNENLKLCRKKEEISESLLFDKKINLFRFNDKEDNTQYSLRKLKEDRFIFHELLRKESQSDKSDAPFLIINQLHRSIRDFSSHLNYGEELVVATASKTYLDSLYYIPYESYFSIDLGSLAEITYASKLGVGSRDTMSWRWSVSLIFNSIIDFQESDEEARVIIPALGIEKTILSMSKDSTQFILGAKTGYMFSDNDDYNSDKCTERIGQFMACSGWYAQAYPMVTFFERLRLKTFIQYVHATENQEISSGLELGFNF